jgi:hypothetical protein
MKGSTALFYALATLAFCGRVSAYESNADAPSVMNHSAMEMADNRPFMQEPASPYRFSPSGTAYPYSGRNIGQTPGRPIVMLPMPIPLDSGAGLGSPYGYHYPGSYLPRDTPLHRFNGYVVCDPPDISGNMVAGSVAGAPPRRLVKITSTRSLASPGRSQPCPVYTINGELQNQKGRSAATMPFPNAPPTR